MYFIKFLLILIVAVSAAVFIQSTPGLILIELGDYTLAGPLWLVVLIVLLTILVLRVLFRFGAWVVNAPRGLRLFVFGSKTAKIDRHLKEFLIASLIANPKQERKNLTALSKLKFYPGLCAAKAALLAVEQGKALDYLESLELAKSDIEMSPWMITLVELHEAMQHPNKEKELESLIQILKNEPEAQSAIWPLEVRYARQLADFNRLREAASQLKTLKLIESDAYLKLLLDCDLGNLAQAKEVEELKSFWNDLPKRKRKTLPFVAQFSKKLLEFGKKEEAALQLEAALQHSWSDELFALYASIVSEHCVKQLEKAEKWAQDMPQNASNYCALAQLYEANLVLVKAEQCYEKSLGYEKSQGAYFGLAGVMMAKGQWQVAAQYYKKAALVS